MTDELKITSYPGTNVISSGAGKAPHRGVYLQVINITSMNQKDKIYILITEACLALSHIEHKYSIPSLKDQDKILSS